MYAHKSLIPHYYIFGVGEVGCVEMKRSRYWKNIQVEVLEKQNTVLDE